jgi:hypothetical protein
MIIQAFSTASYRSAAPPPLPHLFSSSSQKGTYSGTKKRGRGMLRIQHASVLCRIRAQWLLLLLFVVDHNFSSNFSFLRLFLQERIYVHLPSVCISGVEILHFMNITNVAYIFFKPLMIIQSFSNPHFHSINPRAP